MQTYHDTWNTARGMPIEERMDFAMATCTMKAIVRHHFYMKTGSGCDRVSDCMMTFAFGWGKTDIQNRFRRSEIESMTDEEKKTMQDKTSLIISDYQVTSTKRFKHITNEMFLNGPCDADSHSPRHSESQGVQSEKEGEHLGKFLAI